MTTDTIIYNALAPFNATKTLGDNSQTPYIVFATTAETTKNRDRAYLETTELIVTIVADSYSEVDSIGLQVIAAIEGSGLFVSRYGTEDSVIEEKFVKDIDFTLIKTL